MLLRFPGHHPAMSSPLWVCIRGSRRQSLVAILFQAEQRQGPVNPSAVQSHRLGSRHWVAHVCKVTWEHGMATPKRRVQMHNRMQKSNSDVKTRHVKLTMMSSTVVSCSRLPLPTPPAASFPRKPVQSRDGNRNNASMRGYRRDSPVHKARKSEKL